MQKKIKHSVKKVFVVGNGKSITNIDLSPLLKLGRVYGCGFIYKYHKINSLVNIDPKRSHSIYHSGYPIDNKCYFFSWVSLPESNYDKLISAIDDCEIIENKKEDSKEFVIHATEKTRQVFSSAFWKTIKKEIQEELLQSKFLEWKKRGFLPKEIYISWIKKDKVVNINSCYSNSGCTALNLACEIEKPQQVYMLGMDANRYNDPVKVDYKVIEGYYLPHKWNESKKIIFKKYPNIEFIQVNKNRPEEWEGVKNLKYMDNGKNLKYIDNIKEK